MTISIDGIRNFTIGNLMDFSGDWGIIISDEDRISTDWTSNTVRNVRESIVRYAPGIDLFDVLPSFREFDVDMPMEKADADSFNRSIILPTKCMEVFKQHSILSKAKESDDSSYHQLSWLYDNWENGFYIFLNY